ncbi:MAG: ATP-binding protein, partial [Hydrogenovibrio sp.]|nr:ATP-binding protein [Hydrogenovibrio sp.]
PVFNHAGEILYFVSIRTDITDVKTLEEEASRAENRLKLSQQFANIGTWEWHIENGDLWWSDRIAPMFGGDRTEMSTSYENFMNAVHEDDRLMLQSAVQACIEDGREYDIEHRVVWPNGEVRWLHERGDVLRNANGDPVSMLGAVQDITQKKHFERIMVRQQRLLNVLHETTLRYLTTQDFARFCEDMLDNLIQVSGAELAMIAEVAHDDKGHSILKNRFIKDVGWEEAQRQDYQEKMNAGQLKHLQVLFDHTLENQELLIVNDPFSYPKYQPSPESGICIENYIGIPVFMGTDLCGMFSLGNRTDGFDYDLYELLSPFIATFGVMIFSKRLQEQEEVRVQELNTARLRAEDANRSKSAFLSSMSHELRTPLNAIIGFSQLLSMSALSETQSEQVQDILQSSHHLLTLINDVLDLARIDAGQLVLEIKPVEIDQVVNEAIQMVQHLAENHQVEIRLSEALRDKKGMADFTRLKQVVINFLTNAIKYNRPGGRVFIDLEEIAETGQYRLLVEDSGIGISEPFQNKVFEPFNRLGHEARSIEGTGIGLTISKMLAEAMNGDIGFRSTEGEGSVFWISLPNETSVKQSIEPPRRPVSEVQRLETHSDSPSVESGATEVPKTKKVLYIEDNVANMRLMSEIVKQVPSIELFISVSAEEGIDKVKVLAPDLILVDINLPGMSGQEALPVLRQTLAENGLSAEIVAISANAMPQEVDDGIRSGFDGYLTKPVSVVEVVNLLKQIERKS